MFQISRGTGGGRRLDGSNSGRRRDPEFGQAWWKKSADLAIIHSAAEFALWDLARRTISWYLKPPAANSRQMDPDLEFAPNVFW